MRARNYISRPRPQGSRLSPSTLLGASPFIFPDDRSHNCQAAHLNEQRHPAHFALVGQGADTSADGEFESHWQIPEPKLGDKEEPWVIIANSSSSLNPSLAVMPLDPVKTATLGPSESSPTHSKASVQDSQSKDRHLVCSSKNSTTSEAKTAYKSSDVTDQDFILPNNVMNSNYKPKTPKDPMLFFGSPTNLFHIPEELLAEHLGEDHIHYLDSPWTMPAVSFGSDTTAKEPPGSSSTTGRRLLKPVKRSKGSLAVTNQSKAPGFDHSEEPEQHLGLVGTSSPTQADNNTSEGKTLSCPFYKHDKLRHAACLKYTLKRVKDVTQHIARRHLQPKLYCPVCYVVFSSSPGRLEYENHIRARSCSPQPRPDWGGLTDEEWSSIRNTRRDRLKAGVEEQWYSLWDQIFAGKSRPRSPYVEHGFGEFRELVRDCWARSGPEIIASVLAKRSVQLAGEAPSEEKNVSGVLRADKLPELIDAAVSLLLNRSEGARPLAIDSAENTSTREGNPCPPATAVTGHQREVVEEDQNSGSQTREPSHGKSYEQQKAVVPGTRDLFGGIDVADLSSFEQQHHGSEVVQETSHDHQSQKVLDNSDGSGWEAEEPTEATGPHEPLDQIQQVDSWFDDQSDDWLALLDF